MKTDLFLLAMGCAIIIIFSNGCKSDSSVPVIPTVNFEEARSNRQGLLLSDYVEDLKFIRLETNESCLTGGSNINHLFSNDYLMVSQSRTPLLVFNADGKFVRSVGTIGRGPGEIPESYNFTFNPTDSTILFFSSVRESISVYSIHGNYLRDISLGHGLLSLKYLYEDLFYAGLNLVPEADTLGYNHIIFNSKGEVVEKYRLKGYTQPNFGSAEYTAYITPRPIAKVIDGEVFIYSTFNDTIFKISKDKEIVPVITWDKGSLTPPGGLTSNVTMSISERRNYLFELGDFGKMGHYWFFGVPFPNDYSIIVYDELSGEAFNHIRGTNDIDGTVWTFPHFGRVFNNTFVSLYSPRSLRRMMESGRYDIDEIAYPDRNKAFKEMVLTLDDDDNPVAAVFTLKR